MVGGSETADGGTQPRSFTGTWDVDVRCGWLTEGPLTLDRAAFKAHFVDEVLTVSAFDAEGMGGRLEATGLVDDTGLVMDGRLMDADLTQFMEETFGFGIGHIASSPRARKGMGGGSGRLFIRQNGIIVLGGRHPGSAGGRGERLLELLQQIPEVPNRKEEIPDDR